MTQQLREALDMGATFEFECYAPAWIGVDEGVDLAAFLEGLEAAGRPVYVVEQGLNVALVPVDQAEFLVETYPFVQMMERDEGPKWVDGFENLMVNEGLDDVLDKYFNGSSYTAAHFIGLKDNTAPAAGDTMTQAAAQEVTAYDEANRQSYTPGAVSGQSVDNSGSVAQFTISTNGTSIAGAFTTTDNTKGGTTGTLVSSGLFGSAKSADDGDLIKVTVTYNAQDV